MLLFEWPVLTEMISKVEPYSIECCGFIMGIEVGANKVSTQIMPVDNSVQDDRQPYSYKITAMDYQHAEEMADALGAKLLGVYHSHPDRPAIPSDYDLKAAQPNFIYVIISVYHQKMTEVRSWQLNDLDQFDEVPIDMLPLAWNGQRNAMK